MNKAQLNEELKTALKSKNQPALRALRALKTAVSNVETQKNASEVTDEGMMKIIQKQVAQRKDSASQFRANNREELAITEEEEIAVLEQYLPEQMSEEEVKAVVKRIVEQTGASSMRDMGKVMVMTNKELSGKTESKTIAKYAKQLLA